MSVCSSRERNRLAHDAEGRVACLLLGSSWYADISSRTRYKRLCDVRVSVCVCVCVCAHSVRAKKDERAGASCMNVTPRRALARWIDGFIFHLSGPVSISIPA